MEPVIIPEMLPFVHHILIYKCPTAVPDFGAPCHSFNVAEICPGSEMIMVWSKSTVGLWFPTVGLCVSAILNVMDQNLTQTVYVSFTFLLLVRFSCWREVLEFTKRNRISHWAW